MSLPEGWTSGGNDEEEKMGKREEEWKAGGFETGE